MLKEKGNCGNLRKSKHLWCWVALTWNCNWMVGLNLANTCWIGADITPSPFMSVWRVVRKNPKSSGNVGCFPCIITVSPCWGEWFKTEMGWAGCLCWRAGARYFWSCNHQDSELSLKIAWIYGKTSIGACWSLLPVVILVGVYLGERMLIISAEQLIHKLESMHPCK